MSDPVDAWLDGTADEAACAALAERMRGDPALARRLVDGARDEVLLGLALGRRSDLAARVVAGLRGGASRVRLRQAVMREVRTRRHRGSRAWLVPVLAAAAVIALAAVWVAVGETSTSPAVAPSAGLGRATAASAGVVVVRSGDNRALAAGDRLLAADLLRVPTGGSVSLEVQGARLDLASGSVLALLDGDNLRLDSGRLGAEVDPRPAGHPLAIATPQATATIIGTAFALSVGEGATRLDVSHGRVRLATTAGAVEVAAGGSAEARSGAAPALWRDLFTGFPAWQQQHGTWSVANGVVHGTGSEAKARLLSPGDHQDLELTCRLRIRGVPFAEVQVGDYNWFVEVPARDEWVAVRLVQRGTSLTCTADGVVLPVQAGAGAPPRPGPLAFYVRSGSLDIADARILE